MRRKSETFLEYTFLCTTNWALVLYVEVFDRREPTAPQPFEFMAVTQKLLNATCSEVARESGDVSGVLHANHVGIGIAPLVGSKHLSPPWSLT